MPPELPPRDPADRLRSAGLRVTRHRLAVLSALDERPHLDADTITRTARREILSLSPQAVYGVLHALTAHGLARRIEPAGGAARYETRVGDNHHHMVCRGCGVTVDVDCARGSAPCMDPADAAGFAVDEAEVTYWGSCPVCQQDIENSTRQRKGARS